MSVIEVLWDLDDDPDGNVMHIAEHGVTQHEVVEVLSSPLGHESSRSSGRPIAFGLTSTGKLLAVIYELVEQDVYYPVTAYEVEES